MLLHRPFGPGRFNRRSGIKDVQPVPWPQSPTILSDGLHILAELNGPGGVWTDITDDVLQSATVSVEYGISGASPTDLVASTGRMTFSLSNAATANSGAKLGYYSPEHTNVRSGFRLGIGVRFSWWVNGTPYYKFTGSLEVIDPQSGQYLERQVACLAVDYMNELALVRLSGIPTLANKRADQIITTLFGSMVKQPTAVQLDEGDSTFAYALDSGPSEAIQVMSEIQRTVQSEFGLFVVEGDGTVRFYNRTARVQAEVLSTLDDSSMNLLYGPQERGAVLNRVHAVVHPRRVGTPGETLFSLQSKPTVQPGGFIPLSGRYNDPNARAIRIGGKDMIAPVATTDYTMNTAEDGSGSDLTANFLVEPVYGANSVDYKITNNSGSVGYITKLQARGTGLYDYDQVEARAIDETSRSTYGERVFSLDMPYESDSNVGQAVADFILATWKDPIATSVQVGFIVTTPAELLLALSREPGHAIAVMETATGIVGTFRIQQVRLSVAPGQIMTCSWLLQRVLAEDYWAVGVAGKSEVGETTIVGPL